MRAVFPLGSDLAFSVFFGLFILALVVLAFVAIRWGVRRDRPGREAWKRRHLDAAARRDRSGRPGSSDWSPSENGEHG